MKQTILGLGITLIFAGAVMAQKTAKTNSSAAVDHSSIITSTSGIAAGTQISGELQNSLDVRKAKVGDQVLLKTTKTIKQNGKTMVAKGSTLAGRVTSVQKQVKGNADSSISVAFNRLQQGSKTIPINAVITSVLSAQTASSLTTGDAQVDGYGSSSTGTSGRSSGGNGGLLGGVGNTVGSAVNTTTQTVGRVVNTTSQTIGTRTGAVGNTVKGLTISQSTNASTQGGSTLNMSGSNLHLDKGTTFNLAFSSSTSASIDKE